MSDFKGRHFGGEIVLWGVRWYCRYGISYRDLEQMMAERGVSVDHSTIYRWVQRYAPGEARLVERAFGLGACALTEAVQLVGERLEAARARARTRAGASRATARSLQQGRKQRPRSFQIGRREPFCEPCINRLQHCFRIGGTPLVS